MDAIKKSVTVQGEINNYARSAWEASERLTASLTAARDSLVQGASLYPHLAPAVLTITVAERADPSIGFRRLDLAGFKTTGFVEANGGSIGLICAEVRNNQSRGVIFEASMRVTDEVAPKTIADLCQNITRALLLA